MNRIAILEKDHMTGTIGIFEHEGIWYGTQWDGRTGLKFWKQESKKSAFEKFQNALYTSVDLGWRVIYNGERLNG